MLEKLTLTDFEALIGEPFELERDGEVAPARLLEARGGGPGPAGFRAPFSLVILAEMPAGHWPQGTYRLSHEKLGNMDLFMVPIGPGEQGMRYEISFS
jgi:hypothetical protein